MFLKKKILENSPVEPLVQKSNFFNLATSPIISWYRELTSERFVISSSAKNDLKDLRNVIKLQILDLILMIWARFHRASADKLQNGRIICRFGSWLTFFNGGDAFFDSAFLARHVVLGDDGVLVNRVR